MKHGKTVAGAMAVLLLVSHNPVRAMAGSPEFAYTAEKWAALRDNKLEYEEIGDLVHEYNNTVIQNQIEYEEFRGEDKDDIAEDYYDAADEIYASLYYPSSDQDNYAGSLSSYLNGQVQADKLKEQGDDNVEDGEIKKLGYDQTKAQLVKQAQELMVTYWSQHRSLDSLRRNEETARTNYNSTVAKLNAGMSTQAQVLLAEEGVSSAQASLLSGEASLNSTKESLCLMLGWSYGAEVEIGEVPEPDLEAVASIDLDRDVERGVEASYALKILEKKIANAKSGSNKESLEEQYKSQKETAASSIKSAYRSLTLAKSEYDQAVNAWNLELDAMGTAERKLQAGTITRNDYTKQQASCANAEVAAQTARLALLTAMIEYQWSVDGLAAVA